MLLMFWGGLPGLSELGCLDYVGKSVSGFVDPDATWDRWSEDLLL